MELSYRIACIGDLHWGAVPPERLSQELEEVVIRWLEENSIDAVLQLGDYFDKRLSLDSEDAKAALRFAVRICQLCQARGIPFRICKGGIAHDYAQLQNYHPLETEYSVFRVISTAQHEELLPGYDVLWIPEEYPTSYGDYYSQFLYDEDGSALVYDAIFGHGETDVAAGWSAVIEGERHYGGTPCHSAELLLTHSSGPVWLGHIHNRFRHKKRLGYPGSFTRWCQGEEVVKGFDVLEVVQKKVGSWTVKASVVENPLAPVYRTVLASEILTAADSVDEIVAKIRAEAESAFKLRVKMLDFPIGVEELSVVRGALVTDHRIDLQTSARAVNETTQQERVEGDETEEEQSDRADRLSYLRDPSLPGEERLLRYLHEKFPDRADVTVEEVRELTAPLVA